MKFNKYYKLEIMGRFMSVKELEEFTEEYNQAKILTLGRKVLNPHEKEQ